MSRASPAGGPGLGQPPAARASRSSAQGSEGGRGLELRAGGCVAGSDLCPGEAGGSQAWADGEPGRLRTEELLLLPGEDEEKTAEELEPPEEQPREDVSEHLEMSSD